MPPTIPNPNPTIREAVAVFDNGASLQAAIDGLLGSGFDRAEISLLAGERTVAAKLGGRYRVADAEDDPSAPRTFYIAGEDVGDAKGALIGGLIYITAITAAGAAVASGGTLAGALAVAALMGITGGLVGSTLAGWVGDHHARYLQRQLDRGGLLLWVRTRDSEHEARARSVLARCGARDVHVHDLPAAATVAAAAAGEGRGTDLEWALLDPNLVFREPEEVLRRGDLSTEQKVLILRRWDDDARELEVAEEEGMGGGEPNPRARVRAALRQLRAGLPGAAV